MTEPAFKSAFLQTLQARGYIHQITHPAELDEAAASGIVPAYIGFDATAASLHVGSLIQIMMLRRLQQTGHKPIVLMGGGTTKIGDPTDKDQSRPLLTEAQTMQNTMSPGRIPVSTIVSVRTICTPMLGKAQTSVTKPCPLGFTRTPVAAPSPTSAIPAREVTEYRGNAERRCASICCEVAPG